MHPEIWWDCLEISYSLSFCVTIRGQDWLSQLPCANMVAGETEVILKSFFFKHNTEVAFLHKKEMENRERKKINNP